MRGGGTKGDYIFREFDEDGNEGMTDRQYASWLRLLSLNLTMIKGIDDPVEFDRALNELTECLREGLEDDVPEDLEEMTREEISEEFNRELNGDWCE